MIIRSGFLLHQKLHRELALYTVASFLHTSFSHPFWVVSTYRHLLANNLIFSGDRFFSPFSLQWCRVCCSTLAAHKRTIEEYRVHKIMGRYLAYQLLAAVFLGSGFEA